MRGCDRDALRAGFCDPLRGRRMTGLAVGEFEAAIALGLVGQHFVDAAHVARIVAERSLDKLVHNRERFFRGMHPAAHGDHVRVVVLATQMRGLSGPSQNRADPRHAVRGQLLAISGAANHHTEGTRIGNYRLSSSDTVGRVVVLGVIFVRAVVHHLVALGFQVLDEGILEFKTGVIGAKMDSHTNNLGTVTRRNSQVRQS